MFIGEYLQLIVVALMEFVASAYTDAYTVDTTTTNANS